MATRFGFTDRVSRIRRLAAALSVAALACGCEAAAPEGDEFDQAYTSYLHKCADCHAPGASGKTEKTETSLDFSTAATARATLQGGKATGLKAPEDVCNGAPFVVAGKPEQSLLIAVIDADTRSKFDAPAHPGCDQDGIRDMTKWVGPNADAVAKLKAWITAGAK